MVLKNISGQILVETRHKTIKSTLEYCAKNRIFLNGVLVRCARIRDAKLDDLVAQNAVFWGCDFTGSDMGYADFSNTDFRACNFTDVCFAKSNLKGVDMHGVYFSKTLFDETILDNAKISCPSFWGCDISHIASMQNFIFSHMGECDIVITQQPFMIRYNKDCMVLFENHCLWRGGLYPMGLLPPNATRSVFDVKMQLEKILKKGHSQIAKRPIRKIVHADL